MSGLRASRHRVSLTRLAHTSKAAARQSSRRRPIADPPAVNRDHSGSARPPRSLPLCCLAGSGTTPRDDSLRHHRLRWDRRCPAAPWITPMQSQPVHNVWHDDAGRDGRTRRASDANPADRLGAGRHCGYRTGMDLRRHSNVDHRDQTAADSEVSRFSGELERSWPQVSPNIPRAHRSRRHRWASRTCPRRVCSVLRLIPPAVGDVRGTGVYNLVAAWP